MQLLVNLKMILEAAMNEKMCAFGSGKKMERHTHPLTVSILRCWMKYYNTL